MMASVHRFEGRIKPIHQTYPLSVRVTIAAAVSAGMSLRTEANDRARYCTEPQFCTVLTGTEEQIRQVDVFRRLALPIQRHRHLWTLCGIVGTVFRVDDGFELVIECTQPQRPSLSNFRKESAQADLVLQKLLRAAESNASAAAPELQGGQDVD